MDRPSDAHLNRWFLIDELGALNKLPALEAGLQTIANQGGAVAVSVQSFAELTQTYGAEAASNLIKHTGSKIMLAASDSKTANACSKIIGNREVKKGSSISNDTNIGTPISAVDVEGEALVTPEDLINLLPLNGYFKISDSYPTARIELTYKRYIKVAKGQELLVRFSNTKKNQTADERHLNMPSQNGGTEFTANAASKADDGPQEPQNKIQSAPSTDLTAQSDLGQAASGRLQRNLTQYNHSSGHDNSTETKAEAANSENTKNDEREKYATKDLNTLDFFDESAKLP